jgi:hypothetical protein
MKNKNVLITVVVLALIVLGAGAYFTLGNKGGQGPKGGPSASQNQGPAPQNSPKTLKDLLASSISQKCTFTNTTEDASTTMDGVVYTSGGKIRGDFTSKTQEKTYVTHIVVENKTNYMWMDDEKAGYKITIDETTATPSTEGQQTNTAVDMNKSFDYKCSPWVADNSLFAVPTNVTFADMSSFANPSQAPSTSGSTGSSTQCSACNSLTGEAKTQCLTALKCQ